ncbi:Uncharacterised protein [Vibrio cholerae]|nr:Uncharacterised protein [Vibrio cholerae]
MLKAALGIEFPKRHLPINRHPIAITVTNDLQADGFTIHHAIVGHTIEGIVGNIIHAVITTLRCLLVGTSRI